MKGLANWRKRAGGRSMTLPCGLEVEVKRVDIVGAMLRGNLREEEQEAVEELIQLDSPPADLQLTDIVRWLPVVNLVVKEAILDPPIGDEPGEDRLGLSELPCADRIFIFNWATGSAR